jgi:uncharacterized DUF497 family protein
VAFEWSPDKAEDNFRKHGVVFSSEAVGVFHDDFAITVADDESDPAEQRFVTLGVGAKARLLVVVYTYRGDDIRIISARPAEPRERAEYEAQL